MTMMAVSPFGGKVLTRAQYMASRKSGIGEPRQGRGRKAAKGPDRWALLRALTEARDHFELSDRTIVVLEALASFHPGRILPAGEPLVVFPSNAELAKRARGMSPATLRRHLSALVENGFITRRDSANGKRYAERGPDGQLLQAYGFDLSPFIARAAQILSAAEQQRLRLSEIRRLRAEVTIRQRDVAKTLDMLRAEGRAGEIADLDARFSHLQGKLSRNADLVQLSTRAAAFHGLQRDIESRSLFPNDVNGLSVKVIDETSVNASQNERHIKRTKPESPFTDRDLEFERAAARPTLQTSPTSPGRKVPTGRVAGKLPKTLPRLPAVAEVARLCPQIVPYARRGFGGWPDLLQAAETVQAMLGVSPDGWRQARLALGPAGAALVVAAMLENAETIRCPGGYLRHLTEEAKQGRFGLDAQLARLRERHLKTIRVAG